MPEVEQRMERLPSDRAKVRRNAWLLAGFAVCVYLGYIAWMFVRFGSGG